ncbi:Similar to ATP6V0A4: V-type proton ATPase 116 kDa subunit a isoform 4 (Homo sapiens) [Cotesia congregata]|uniref:V-type proton ATPase subunit a n=1 Tax=Cotesia congregata TaxID=51543 RepID=A0A8J2H9D2_COTCN|nr:Similar to ATP6V0A4: V-type proton ATPase 116 kDa subunit a isoform 4 (Homo sapiens) [Cotesia congregata]
MGSLFRSEEMTLCQLFLQSEAAYACVSELGELGLVQFRDLNPDVNAFQRKFVNEVRRCDEMERKLRYLEKEIKKDGIPMLDTGENPEAPQPREMIDLEATFEKLENELREVNQNAEALKRNFLELTELKHILRKTQVFFDEMADPSREEEQVTLLGEEGLRAGGQALKLGFVAGVILRERIPAFERMLWRACRGNVFLRQAEIESPLEDPSTVTAAKNLKNWFIKVRKIKAIYHTLNLFNLDVTQKCLIAECWVPVLDIETIQLALRRGTERSGSSVPPILNRMESFEDPPTYNRTNKFTKGFQALIDAYGVASYREMNPAPYTIVTFPFLFAVMFGDCGHGAIMFFFGLWMILKEKPLSAQKSDNEIWNIFFGGRYIIFLMGLFSMYTGLIYNDIFSKSLNIFGSYWEVNLDWKTINTNKGLSLDPKPDYVGHPYPLGMDPVWQLAENKIIFLNSYKMKISIIFGIIQMLFGVIVSLKNHLYFKRSLNVIYEFIPQVFFLVCLFLYMCLMMFIKWSSYSATNPDPYSTHCAPSILITFIDMVLFASPKEKDPKDPCDKFMYGGQFGLQRFLVVIALLCVPVLLLAKPIMIMRGRKQHQQLNNHGQENGDVEGAGAVVQNPVHREEEEMGEIFIHQGIHTIEFVLGSISHTASYLRLWALSLAHAQLSEVLWNMVMKIGLTSGDWFGGVVLWVLFAFWAVLTVGILVLMEGLSAFLHTLRLHWVEFQSKFYEGTGYTFSPFSFEIILESAQTTTEE